MALTPYMVTMRATEKLGSKVPFPTAPLGPLSSVACHLTYRDREKYDVTLC